MSDSASRRGAEPVRARLPYGLASWVPVLRGGTPPVAVVRDDDGAEVVRTRWSETREGERLALVAEGHPGSLAPMDDLENALDGARQLERYVAFPGTGGGFVLLDTASPEALRGGLALLPSGRRRWRAAKLGLDALAPLGLARRLGLPEVVLATKGPAGPREDAVAAPELHLAVASGVPDSRQKMVARLLESDGQTRAIAKLAHAPHSHDAVRREIEALGVLAQKAPELAPSLIDHGTTDGRPWLTQEPLDGRRSPDVFTPGHSAFLHRLWTASAGRLALESHPHLVDAIARLERLDVSHDPDWHAEMSALAGHLAKDRCELPTALAHGDFTSWNLAVGPHGMRAFDWEAYEPDAPALFDVFHFHVQSGVLVHRREGGSLLDSLGEVLARPAAQLVRAANMRSEDALRAFGLYLLHVATREEERQRDIPAPFMQAGWQRRARRELVRRVVGLLSERRLPWTLSSDVGAPAPERRDKDAA